MRLIISLLCMGTLVGILAGESVAAEEVKRPNIIFLMTDNQRWDALGCYGNEIIRTPHIDRLAAQGVRFTSAFCTTSICSASRASILTGQYRRVHGYSFETPPMSTVALRNSYPCILRAAGYRTGFVGKIGVDLETGACDEMFDFARFAQASSTKEPYYRRGADWKTKHLTEINGDDAIEFLRETDRDIPFCLSVSFSAPHPEDDNPEQYVYDRRLEKLYRKATIPPPPVSQRENFEQLPEFLRVSMNRQRWFRRFDNPDKYQAMVKGMYRLLTGVDNQVGRIVAELERLGLADNTVIIYTSDNGLMVGEHGLTGIWLMYEASIRLPLVIYDPRLPSTSQGQVASQLALNVDYAATILDLAGVDLAEIDRSHTESVPAMPGRSLKPLLYGRADDWPVDFFYEHYYRPSHIKTNENNIPRSEGVRTERWKYIHYFDEQPVYEQLFDLANDPHETRNLARDARHRDTLEKLRERLQVLRAKSSQTVTAAE